MNNNYGLILMIALITSCSFNKTHHDWEDQSITEINKLPARAAYFPFESLELAKNRSKKTINEVLILKR